MYQFVMWGLGIVGRRFLNICPSERVVAIIDSNVELQGKKFCGVPIISYKDYLKRYREYDVLVTPRVYDSIYKALKDAAVNNVLFLENCPPEIKGNYGDTWIDKLPITIENSCSVIYGLNLYSILLREYLIETQNFYLDIIPEEDNSISRAFSQKYSYVTMRKILSDETVLWASSYQIMEIPNEIINIFNFLGKIDSYQNPQLGQFKNVAEKKRCFLIGNGPSLKMEDLDMLYKQQEDCFGVNKIYKAFSNTKWRPKYYCVTDNLHIEEGIDEMQKIAGCTAFYANVTPRMKDKVKNDNYSFDVHLHELPFKKNDVPAFSDNVIDGIYGGRSVIYGCMQIAIYMGYKEIYLLGVDHSYVGSPLESENHFIANYHDNGSRANEYRPKEVEKAFGAAKSYADFHGIKIYNATRGGKLEVFERVDFDSLFDK